MNNYNEEVDLSLAIQLQAQFEEELRVQRIKEEEKKKSLDVVGHKWNAKWMNLSEPEQEKLSVSLVDSCWEHLDPTPNIFDLFLTFNHQFFWGRLMGVEVKWSPRMTLCAGVCSYEGRGGLCSVRLSTPLLKLRPRKDLIETLLHEMIHAYLFVTHNNTDHDGHGPQFHKHMFRINKLAGTKITVYHSFHDEVAAYRQHIWKCDGPCRKRPPYYGLVKRSMNRAPSPRDLWWETHAQNCGGTYTKIQEPEGYGVKKSKRKVQDESNKDIRSYFPNSGNKKPKPLPGKENSGSTSNLDGSTIVGLPKSTSGQTSVKFGNVSRVDVQNASNSNVHGFGNQNGKVTKKTGNNSQNGKSFTGSKNSNSQNGKNINSGHTNSQSGKSFKGSGMNATRTSSGSKTIVVNKKKEPGTEVKLENSGNLGASFASFSGSGYVLGTSNSIGNGKSRLLSQFDRKPEAPARIPETPPDEPPTICPLCQIPVNSDEFEEHIGECLGDFDADPDFDSDVSSGNSNSLVENTAKNTNSNFTAKNTTTASTSNNNVNNHTDDCVTILSDEESDVQNIVDLANMSFGAEGCSVLFPCPVCNEMFEESKINFHVNNHFS